MTIIAGALDLTEGEGLAPQIRDQIRKVISRKPDHITEFADRHCFVAKVDIGAFDSPAAYRDEAGNVSLLAGEPLLRRKHHETARDRAADLEQLHDQWIRSDWSGLTQCTGTFCAVHYRSGQPSLSLVADKLGLRPIYYWASPEVVIFATALRILEEIQVVPLNIDLRGVTETAVFGYPLGERTAYAGISAIGPGQIVRVSANGVQRSDYWRWDRLPQIHSDPSEIAKDVYRRFVSAVDRRIRGERTAIAFLTGGLDSRSIVTALLERGMMVDTINFALEGTQDRVFASELARVLGTRHHQLSADLHSMYAFRGRPWNQGLVARWFDSDPETRSQRRQIWSGDGGSVGLGHVYLNHQIVDFAQGGKMDAAIDAFMQYNQQGVFARILQPDMTHTIVAMPRQGIREELARLDCPDRGRALHLFLMLNDQRRHLANFFENIDVDRLEFQLPFFDGDFLEPILRSPTEGFLGHEFYMRWLENFPKTTVSVPWQAYPGHVPCPLPMPQGLLYQWKDPFPHHILKQLKQSLLREIDMFLKSSHFPQTIINRRNLRLASWLTRLGIRNCDYLLKMAAVYCRYSAGGGRAANENKATP